MSTADRKLRALRAAACCFAALLPAAQAAGADPYIERVQGPRYPTGRSCAANGRGGMRARSISFRRGHDVEIKGRRPVNPALAEEARWRGSDSASSGRALRAWSPSPSASTSSRPRARSACLPLPTECCGCTSPRRAPDRRGRRHGGRHRFRHRRSVERKGDLELRLPVGELNILVGSPEYRPCRSRCRSPRHDPRGNAYLYARGRASSPPPFPASAAATRRRRVQLDREELRNVRAPGRPSPRRLASCQASPALLSRAASSIVRGARPTDTGAYLNGQRIPISTTCSTGPSVGLQDSAGGQHRLPRRRRGGLLRKRSLPPSSGCGRASAIRSESTASRRRSGQGVRWLEGPVEQVVEDGDALPCEIGAGIGGPRAAHDELAARERSAGDAWQERDARRGSSWVPGTLRNSSRSSWTGSARRGGARRERWRRLARPRAVEVRGFLEGRAAAICTWTCQGPVLGRADEDVQLAHRKAELEIALPARHCAGAETDGDRRGAGHVGPGARLGDVQPQHSVGSGRQADLALGRLEVEAEGDGDQARSARPLEAESEPRHAGLLGERGIDGAVGLDLDVGDLSGRRSSSTHSTTPVSPRRSAPVG